MKKALSTLVLSLSALVGVCQGIYFDPSPVIHGEQVRLYVDLNSSDCDCIELQDADSETNPLYIWTWAPVEARPDLIVENESLNILNGMWSESNENLRLTQDENSPFLWYFDFLGASLSEFYDVSSLNEFEDGISFLIKEKDGGPAGLPEQKSQDINIPVIFEGMEDFTIQNVNILSEITEATAITHANDERLFATEQSGRIRTFNRDGEVDSEIFLDIEDRVTAGGERGLLGLAFPNNFCESGRFYVNYTHTAVVNPDSTQLRTRISRFFVDSDNPEIGDSDSEEILLELDQDFANHNGGHIEFGSDGFLYIGTGDGGEANDPNNRAQDITSYLGKILRIDVSTETGYEIPADNPYVFDDFGQDEIWSFGLRNPWKFAFDKETGDTYIADVGQNAFEEINFEPIEAGGGLNYGWRCYEGNAENVLTDCTASDYVFPITEYAHTNGNCSVTGGRVYRGLSYEAFEGYYFYSDLCSGAYRAVTLIGELAFVQELGTIGQSGVTTFGEDVWGEVYFSNGNGIHRLIDPNDELIDPIAQSSGTLSSSVNGVSYEWFFDGELIGSSAELEISEVGEYTLLLTTANSPCQIESSIDVTSLSSSDFSNAKNPLTVFPNPALNSVTIDFDTYSSNAHSLAIYSIDGRLIHSERVNTNQLELDLSEYSKGAYFLNLLDASGNSIAQAKMIRK